MITRLLCIVSLGLGCFSCAGQSASAPKTVPPPIVCDVRAAGAVGDGTTLDTAAFQRALDACILTGGEVLVPAGNYRIGSVIMHSRTTLRLAAGAALTGSPNADDYPLMTVRWEGRWRQGHRALIHAAKADHIAIVGPGKIAGDPKLGTLRNPRAPVIFEPIECNDVRVEDVTITNNRIWSLHPTLCCDVLARGLTIRTTGGNGDGIDVDSCTNVRIDRCDIDSGDDCIALKSGRGMEGFTAAQPTQDVLITDCKLGSRFAGLGIGSEMSGGIRDVRIERCTFTHGANAIYIKGNDVRGGYVQNVHGQWLDAHSRGCFVRINFLNSGIPDEHPVEGLDGIPFVGDFAFSDATVDCATLLDATRLPPEKPLEGLSLVGVSGACRSGISLCNMGGVELSNIRVAVAEGPELAISNVSGVGLSGAVPYVPPATQPSGATRPMRGGRAARPPGDAEQ